MTQICCPEGGERSVHRDGLVDQDTTGGIERRAEETRDTTGRKDSLGDIKEDPGPFLTPRLSSEGASLLSRIRRSKIEWKSKIES